MDPRTTPATVAEVNELRDRIIALEELVGVISVDDGRAIVDLQRRVTALGRRTTQGDVGAITEVYPPEGSRAGAFDAIRQRIDNAGDWDHVRAQAIRYGITMNGAPYPGHGTGRSCHVCGHGQSEHVGGIECEPYPGSAAAGHGKRPAIDVARDRYIGPGTMHHRP